MAKPFLSWMREARAMEADDMKAATLEYEQIRKNFPLREEVYDRLMIMYRKEKEPAKEKKLIGEAIHHFQQHFGSAKDHPSGSKITSISRSLSRSLGLTDKKGKPAYYMEPVKRWSKRLELLTKKNR